MKLAKKVGLMIIAIIHVKTPCVQYFGNCEKNLMELYVRKSASVIAFFIYITKQFKGKKTN